jgi:hypothetical protein
MPKHIRRKIQDQVAENKPNKPENHQPFETGKPFRITTKQTMSWIWVLIIILIVAFLIWKFVLSKKSMGKAGQYYF